MLLLEAVKDHAGDHMISFLISISVTILLVTLTFASVLHRQLTLSKKLKKHIFITSKSSDKAKVIINLLKESIFNFRDGSGDLNSVDTINPDDILLIGLVYEGPDKDNDLILNKARAHKIPLIVYCPDCDLDEKFHSKLKTYRWFDSCRTPYRFTSVALAAITSNNQGTLKDKLKGYIWRL